MSFNEHLKTFAGLSVRPYRHGQETLDCQNVAYRFQYSWEKEAGPGAIALIRDFFEKPGSEQVIGFIVGNHDEDGCYSGEELCNAILENIGKMSNVKGFFMSEALQEDCEVSWIENGDVVPILNALPGLEEFRVRGGLPGFDPIRHISLKTLVIESGGTGKTVFEGIAQSVLPELEHLEIYGGADDYGWDGSIETYRPFLESGRFPNLKYLGLCNCEIADDLAMELASAPVLEQIETLDLSLGNLTDEGARALLKSEHIRSLKKLDLHYHFMTDAVAAEFSNLGIEVDVDRSDAEGWDYDGEIYRNIAVTE